MIKIQLRYAVIPRGGAMRMIGWWRLNRGAATFYIGARCPDEAVLILRSYIAEDSND